MLSDKQKSMIAHTPTFGITQILPSGASLSIRGFRDKGFIEAALIAKDGHIDHNPPFSHDGFGIATFSRSQITEIEDLIQKMYYGK